MAAPKPKSPINFPKPIVISTMPTTPNTSGENRCAKMIPTMNCKPSGNPVLAYHHFKECSALLKGCTKTTFAPLRAALNLGAKASCARESLPQLIFVALHTANLRQLLKDMPFCLVRKPLLERSLFVADPLDTGGEPGR